MADFSNHYQVFCITANIYLCFYYQINLMHKRDPFEDSGSYQPALFPVHPWAILDHELNLVHQRLFHSPLLSSDPDLIVRKALRPFFLEQSHMWGLRGGPSQLVATTECSTIRMRANQEMVIWGRGPFS